MLKIGLLTYHFSNNFGAVLQAYALRRWLREQGHDAGFVNYAPAYFEHGGPFTVGFSRKVLAANIKVAYLRLSTARARVFGDPAQREAFEAFRVNELGATTPVLDDAAAVRAMPHGVDLLVCGSDQIWSPSVQRGLDDVYFLNFGSAATRRISYAASFGSASLAALQADGAAQLLRTLDAISVREESGVRHVRELTGREAALVVDPTCLLDDYRSLAGRVTGPDGGHVFCYALRTDRVVREVVMEVSAALKRPVVTPSNPHSRWRPIGKTVYPGPKEWLSLISTADFVVTNSFHGTVFSILLERPFIVAGLPGARAGLNDRMTSLLSRVGLMDRFLTHADAASVSRVWTQPIDWRVVRQNMRELRDSSEQFLTAQLEAAAAHPAHA